MKILAIRGSNLASLQGEFSLNLDEEPLCQAGIFAITGPTGAGKSTLLDALCLALFDATPRRRGRGGAKVGREKGNEQLAANDPRGLLRQGAGSGYAEVDFVGHEGNRYRARWEVRRARNRPTGKLQQQNMVLMELPSERVISGHTRSATKFQIEQHLRLNFEQFCRSVLLPQGDFAAFLRADPGQRAELLERVTGSEIYARLSQACYEETRERLRVLKQLESEAAAIALLSPTQRAELEAREISLQGRLRCANERAQGVERERLWYESAQALDEQIEAAEQDEREARELVRQAAPRRAELEKVERAQLLRGDAQRRERAGENLAQADEQVADAGAQEEAARITEEGAELALQVAAQAHGAARQARQGAAGDLQHARELDAHCAAARRTWKRAEEASGRAEGLSHQAQEAQAEAEATLTRCNAETEEIRVWLEEHGAILEIAPTWPAARELMGEIPTLNEQIEQLNAEEHRLSTLEAASESELQGSESALDEAEQKCREWEEKVNDALQGESAEKLRHRRQQQERRLADLELAKSWLAALDEIARLQNKGAELEQAAQATTTAVRELHQARESNQQELLEAEQEQARAQAALSLAERRAELRAGQPCDLCGSTAHPWAEHGAPDAQVVRGCDTRVRELRSEREKLTQELAQLEAAQETHAENKGLAEEAALSRQAEVGRLGSAWQESLQADRDLPEHIEEITLTALEAQWGRESLELREAELEREQAGRALQIALREQSAAASRRAQKDKEKQEQLARLQETRQARKHLGEQLREKQEQSRINAERLDHELAALRELDPWRAGLERGSDHVQKLDELVERAGKSQLALQEIEVARTRAAEQSRSADQRLQELRTSWTELSAVTQALRQELLELEMKRQTFFSGEAADVIEAQLDRTLTDAEQAESRARNAAEEARVALGRSRRGSEEAKVRQERSAQEWERANDRLDTQLRILGWTAQDLQSRLRLDDTWIADEREALISLDSALVQAEVRLKERRRQRQAHRDGYQPRLSREDIGTEQDQAAAEIEAATNQRADVLADLRRDQECRSQSQALVPRIEAQRGACEWWEKLNDLIGSADGKKLRTYAQGLSLDLLLRHANVHLRELAPRYALERVPTELSLQVVDRDMADEIRAANSLSGGESFLVSLALALGLSSLTSERTRVDSLFIDEGFGSLDRDSLDVALAMLESLRDTGRTVGLISHVPGVAEQLGYGVRVVPQGGGRSRVLPPSRNT